MNAWEEEEQKREEERIMAFIRPLMDDFVKSFPAAPPLDEGLIVASFDVSDELKRKIVASMQEEIESLSGNERSSWDG